MKIALIGANGQLATDLQDWLARDERRSKHMVAALGHADIELTDAAQVTTVLDELRPDAVINTAAYNLVDRAEDEPDRAYAVNALGPRALAKYCGERDLVLMHFSTDYVFGLETSRTEPFREIDAPGPASAYGTSKLAGEYFVRSLCPRHFVVRTCGLYGIAGRHGAGKGNFVETMLRLGRERPELTIVNDQRCTPTFTSDLAGASLDLLETEAWGLYHATSSGDMTWFEFAREIFTQAGIEISIRPVTSAEYVTKARRPGYSVLNCERLSSVIGYELPHWRDALSRYLQAR